MSKRSVLLIAATVLLTTGFQQPQDKPAPPAPTGSGGGGRVEGSKPAGWIAFSPKDGGFSVMLPGKPSKTSITTDTDKGPVTSPLYKLEKGDFKYVVGYLEHPVSVGSARQDTFLEKAAEKGITDAGGKVVSNKPISLAGNYPGREVKGEVRGFAYHTRVYLVKQRIYMLILWTKPNNPALVTENAAKFFDSFAVLPDAADEVSLAKVALVVAGANGDPNHGPNISLIKAFGYIRKSERRSGLKRGGGSGGSSTPKT